MMYSKYSVPNSGFYYLPKKLDVAQVINQYLIKWNELCSYF